MKKLFLVGIVVLVVLGLLYQGLSTQLENGLTNDAMQRLSTISVEQSDHLKRIYKDSHKDISALYQWPQLSEDIGLFYGGESATVESTLRKTLRQFAGRYDYTNVLLFDSQQNLVLWLNSSPVMMAAAHEKEVLLADLKPMLTTAVNRLQTSVTPFFPSLEALYRGGDDAVFTTLRETFLVAPLISDQKVVGSIALGKRADDLSLLNPAKMRFGQSGHVVFIEKGSEAAFGLRFPRALQGRPEIVRQSLDNTSSQLVRVLNDASGIGLYLDNDGHGQLGQWRYMPEFNMGVMVYQSTDEIYAGLIRFHLLAIFAFYLR